MRSVNAVVKGVLAQHVARHASALRGWHHLDRDLDVTPLELALIALEIEDIEAIELDMDELASIRTVGELCAFVSKAVASAEPTPSLDRVA